MISIRQPSMIDHFKPFKVVVIPADEEIIAS